MYRIAMQHLKDKTAFITGGRRIGLAVAKTLAEHGVNIAMTYRSKPGEMDAATEIGQKLGVETLLVKADVTKPKDVIDAVAETVKKFGSLDILINMASIFVKRDFLKLSQQDFDEEFSVNTTSAFLFAKAAIPQMRKNKWGRIINFSDWTAASGRPSYTQEGYLAYYVAKGAVNHLTQALALEVAKDGITVNAIAPGPILPPDDMSKKEVEDVAARTPQGRWGGAEQIAEAVMYFLNADSFVTGEIIRVNGGRHLK